MSSIKFLLLELIRFMQFLDTSTINRFENNAIGNQIYF